MERCARGGLGLVLVLVLPCLGVQAEEDAGPDPVEIYFDGEACGGEALIDLEVYDRPARQWVPYPERPRFAVPSCRTVDAGSMLNELRWRCATPEGAAPWRNVPVFGKSTWTRCEELRALEEERERILRAKARQQGETAAGLLRPEQHKHLELDAREGAEPPAR